MGIRAEKRLRSPWHERAHQEVTTLANSEKPWAIPWPCLHEFLAIATQLQPLRSLAIYHTSMKEWGCQPLPSEAAFRLEASQSAGRSRG